MAVLVATCVVLVASGEVFATGCSVPNLDETGKTCMGDRCPSGLPCVNGRCGGAVDAGPDASDAADANAESFAACTPPEGGDPCTAIPRLSGVQTLDCVPTEFCDVPAWRFDAPSGGASPATVSLQVAWSDAGLHVFVAVEKWPVLPATTTDLYTGDAIELFVAASSASLQGQLGDDAVHFVGTPPPPNTGLGGQATFFQPNLGPMGYPAPSGIFVGCVIPNVGYDLEIQLPWTLPWLPQTAPPVAGATMGFDFAVDAKPENANVVQTFEYVGPAPDAGAANQCVVNALAEAPYCDDRCSCRPTVR